VQAVLQLSFDDRTDAAIRGFWRRLKDGGLPSVLLDRSATPHITLAACDDVRLDALLDSLTIRLRSAAEVDVTFSSLATFCNENGVLFLSAVVNREMLEIHERVIPSFADNVAPLNRFHELGRWVPHCTLATNLTKGQIAEGLSLFDDISLPMKAKGTEVRLLEFPSLNVLGIWSLA
jgi:2'-5' RNA ligase